MPGYVRDVMAMDFVLLSIGWAVFTIPGKLWPLVERPGGAWASVSLPHLKQRLAKT